MGTLELRSYGGEQYDRQGDILLCPWSLTNIKVFREKKIENRKMAKEKFVVGHSTQPVHQERPTYRPGGHCGLRF